MGLSSTVPLSLPRAPVEKFHRTARNKRVSIHSAVVWGVPWRRKLAHLFEPPTEREPLDRRSENEEGEGAARPLLIGFIET